PPAPREGQRRQWHRRRWWHPARQPVAEHVFGCRLLPGSPRAATRLASAPRCRGTGGPPRPARSPTAPAPQLGGGPPRAREGWAGGVPAAVGIRVGFGISPGPGRSWPCPRDQEARPRPAAGFLGGLLGLRGPRLRLGLGLAVALNLGLAEQVGLRHAQGLRDRLGADLVHLVHLVGGQPAELARILDDPGGRAAGDPVSTVLT